MREVEIQRDILHYLATRSDLRAWRQNTGVAYYENRPVKFGVPGAADISGILNTGTRLEIEVKTPSGSQSQAQKRYQDMITKFGGVYILARCVDDVIEGLPKII